MNGYGEPKTCGKCCESGFGTPLEAMKGEREKLTLGFFLICKNKILQTMFLHNRQYRRFQRKIMQTCWIYNKIQKCPWFLCRLPRTPLETIGPSASNPRLFAFSNHLKKQHQQRYNSCAGQAGKPLAPFPSPQILPSSHRQRIYIPAVQMEKDAKPDYLATIDVDPDSPTYSQANKSIICMKHHETGSIIVPSGSCVQDIPRCLGYKVGSKST